MSEPGPYSFKDILDEYFARLQSSKCEDPKRNLLLQDIKEKLIFAAAGQEKIAVYENYLSFFFSHYWISLCFDKHLEDYKEELEKRLDASTDSETLFEIELKYLGYYDIQDLTLTGDLKVDGKKLGFALAVNGDDPTLFQLVHHLTKYEFGLKLHVTTVSSDFFDATYWDKVYESYSQIFRKLHWVSVGFTNAKKVQHLQHLRSGFSQTKATQQPVEQLEGGKLSHKQQILLLQKLGVFDLPVVKGLTVQKQGKLFATLLGKNEKNTEDYIRYRDGVKVDKKHSLSLPGVQASVADLLKELGIRDI